MNINNLHPHTITVLDIHLNQKSFSGSGLSLGGHDYCTHMKYTDKKSKEIVTIPYQANQLIEQAIFLIRLANHCIESNTNIQYL